MMGHIELKSLNDFKEPIKSREDFLANCQKRLLNKNNLPTNIDYNELHCMPYMNLAICSSILKYYYNDGEKITESYLIKKEDLEKFNITEEELNECCEKNRKVKNGTKILSFIEDSLQKNILSPLTRLPKEAQAFFGPASPAGDNKNFPLPLVNNSGPVKDVLILNNRFQSFSAIAMTDEEVIQQVLDKFNNERFYFIPASVHKIICVRQGFATNNGEKTVHEAELDLLDMTEAINETLNTNVKDVLSYQIYLYDENRIFQIRRTDNV